jgi:hypothetical protein
MRARMKAAGFVWLVSMRTCAPVSALTKPLAMLAATCLHQVGLGFAASRSNASAASFIHEVRDARPTDVEG